MKIIKPELKKYDFDVDLNGLKLTKNFQNKYLLTTKSMANPEFTLGKLMKPILLNVIFDIPGKDIFFGKVQNLKSNEKISPSDRLREYFFYFPMLTTKRIFLLIYMKIFKKI